MENAILIAHVVGPIALVLGVSVFMYMKSWQHVMEKYENDHFALLPMIMMDAVLGAICVNMYNVWTWNVWLLVTLVGWGLVAKAVCYFLLPGNVLKRAIAFKKQTWVLSFGGLAGLVLGGVLTYYSYFAK